jgi:hypothetical protein
LKREVAALCHELATVQAQTRTDLMGMVDEIGKITGGLGREIDELRKKLGDLAR